MPQNYLPNKMSLPHNQKQADTDGDGLVDRKELEQMFDTDGDGVISAQEKIAAAKMFALVDKDGNDIPDAVLACAGL